MVVAGCEPAAVGRDVAARDADGAVCGGRGATGSFAGLPDSQAHERANSHGKIALQRTSG